MNDLHHVSLFSGIGNVDLAMHYAGIPTIAACEIDNAARGVLHDRFPDTHLLTDVTEVTGDQLRALGAEPKRTILSAGFPCQDLSVAGRRRGMGEGTRSGLYWHVDRIMAEFRPAWVVLENVPGLLSACCACPGDGTCTDRGLAVRCDPDGEPHAVPGGGCWGDCIARHGGVMGAVLGSLAERGYGFAYRVLDARYFGVPQRRRRVVIVGCLGDDGRAPTRVLLEPESMRGDSAPRITPRTLVAAASRDGVDAGRIASTLTGHHGRLDANHADQLVVEGVLGDQAHTLTAEGSDASEDGTGRGTPIVYQQHGTNVGPMGTLRAGSESVSSGVPFVAYAPDVAATLTAGTARKPGVNAPGRRQEDDHNIVAFDPKSGGDRTTSGAVEDGTGITPTLVGGRPHAVAFHHQQDPIHGDVSPAIGARTDGMGIMYAAEHTTALDTAQGGPDDNTAQGGQLIATFQKVTRPASSEHPDVWEERDIAATLSPFDMGSDSRAVELVVAPTLTASLGEGGWAGHNRKDEMVERTFEAGATVRRLTPTECERLQGCPDGHTATSWGKAQADSPRYKQLGNAVAVPVFEWVARNIVAVHTGAS